MSLEEWRLPTIGVMNSYRERKQTVADFADNNNMLMYFFTKLGMVPTFSTMKDLVAHLGSEHSPFPYEPEMIRRERTVGYELLSVAMHPDHSNLADYDCIRNICHDFDKKTNSIDRGFALANVELLQQLSMVVDTGHILPRITFEASVLKNILNF